MKSLPMTCFLNPLSRVIGLWRDFQLECINVYRSEATDDSYVQYAKIVNLEPGTMDSICARLSRRPFMVRQLPHRFCAGCGEDGGGRLRLL